MPEIKDVRSFPQIADGRPALPMEADLWAAGCDHETARFVARQLRGNGYYLVRSEDLGWEDIRCFQAEIAKGQDVREDAGGYFIRAIMALFGKRPDPVLTYQSAAEKLLADAQRQEVKMDKKSVENVKVGRRPEIEEAATEAWKNAFEVAARVAERRLESGRPDTIPAALRDRAI